MTKTLNGNSLSVKILLWIVGALFSVATTLAYMGYSDIKTDIQRVQDDMTIAREAALRGQLIDSLTVSKQNEIVRKLIQVEEAIRESP